MLLESVFQVFSWFWVRSEGKQLHFAVRILQSPPEGSRAQPFLSVSGQKQETEKGCFDSAKLLRNCIRLSRTRIFFSVPRDFNYLTEATTVGMIKMDL